ncbi:MAG: hypothetical protein RIT27_905 [Pseudomonadota bacterium]|jgi:hypothetical protein
MKLFKLVIMSFCVLLYSQTAFAFGAIAYSQSTGSMGYSYNASSKKAAISSAVKSCKKRDCRSVIWFNKACGALSVKSNNPAVFATNWNTSRNTAINNANAKCGKNCRSVGSVCDDR